MTVRLYVPTTLEGLARLADEGTLPGSPESVVAPDDDEQTEYDALMTAADGSAELAGTTGRRVVVVAEVDDQDGPVALRQVVAVHADAARGAAPDDDLAWYAVSEIAALLGRV